MALPGETGSKESGAAAGCDQSVTNTNNPTGNTVTTSGTSTNSNTTKQPTNLDQDDRDFDPTAEALIDDIDDERTLEEEEALHGDNANAVQDELDDLKKESEMPIEELLAYYERMRNEAGGNQEEDEEDEFEEEDDDDLDDEDDINDQKAKDDIEKRSKQINENKSTTDNSDCTNSTSNNPSIDQQQVQHQTHIDPSSLAVDSSQQVNNTNENNQYNQQQQPDSISEDAARIHPINSSCQADIPQEDNQLSSTGGSTAISSSGRHKHSMTEFMIEPDGNASGMFKTLLDYDLDDSDDMDEDYSYTDDENGDDERDWRRSIQIGADFQAEVPEGLTEYEGDLLPYEPEDKLVWKCNSDLTQEQLIDYLKNASMLSKRNEYSVSSASVPKISDDTLSLYRERLLEMAGISTTMRLNSIEHNHENAVSEHPNPENFRDVYMSQSRKTGRIEYEIQQENFMDRINQHRAESNPNYVSNLAREENSNSTSQDIRPELSTQDYFQDEEQLLYLLLQCNYNLEEALRRRRLDPSKYYLYEPMSLWSQEECLGFEHGLRIYGKNFHSIRENKVPTRSHSEVVAFYYLWKKSERHDVYTNQYKLDRKRCLTHPGTTDYMDRFIEDNESLINASSSTGTPTPTLTETTNETNHLADMSNGNNNSQLLSMCVPPFQQSSIPRIDQQDGAPVAPAHDCVQINSTIGVGDGSSQTDIIQLDNHNPTAFEHS